MSAVVVSWEPGTTVSGRYRVEGLLGSGGMASVHLAYDPKLNLKVALKLLPPHLAMDPKFVARFRREGQTLAMLSHPNILRLYEIGEDHEQHLYYLVLEYLTGGSLRERAAVKPWALPNTLEVLRPVALALDYAHQSPRSVVHRDLKPANILFASDGRPVVSDFGLVRLLAPEQALSRDASLATMTVGQVVGTPAYMAPEQADGRAVGPAADRYALGVVAYELLVGHVPFHGDTPLATLIQVMTRPLPLPSALNSSIEGPVERVLLKALARDPEDRFDSGSAFVRALEEAANHDATLISRRAQGRALIAAKPDPEGADARPRRTLFGLLWSPVAIVGTAAMLLAAGGIGVAAFNLVQTTTSDAAMPARLTAMPAVPTPELAQLLVVPTSVLARAPTPTAVAPISPPAPTAGPTADDVWRMTLPELDGTWDRDWPQTIETIEGFLNRFPRYRAAEEKRSAALTFQARAMISADQYEKAVAQLERAVSRPPDSAGAPRQAPSAADVWVGTLNELDALWDSDWPRAIDLTSAFPVRYPGHAVAVDKLHSALVAYARVEVSEDHQPSAAALLDRAQELAPDWAEAFQAARVLTPTPAAASIAQAPVVVAPQQASRPAAPAPVLAPTPLPAAQPTPQPPAPKPPPVKAGFTPPPRP